MGCDSQMHAMRTTAIQQDRVRRQRDAAPQLGRTADLEPAVPNRGCGVGARESGPRLALDGHQHSVIGQAARGPLLRRADQGVNYILWSLTPTRSQNPSDAVGTEQLASPAGLANAIDVYDELAPRI